MRTGNIPCTMHTLKNNTHYEIPKIAKTQIKIIGVFHMTFKNKLITYELRHHSNR